MNDYAESIPVLSAIFWIAFAASALVAFPVYRMLLAMKSRQIISEFVPEHAMKQGTPTMGGLIIVIGFVVACGYAMGAGLVKGVTIPAALILCIGFAFIGFLDDFVVPRLIPGKRGLGWKQKLALEILFAGIAVGWLRHGVTPGVGFAVFTILFFANAYNFVDGMDGLAGSILVLLAGGLAALGMLEMRQEVLLVLCLALVGAVIPFLVLNAPPAKVFMGDIGSLPVGAVLGLVAFQIVLPGVVKLPPHSVAALGLMPTHPVATVLQNSIPVFIMSLVMVVELVPVPLQIASVKLRKKRLFPMTPIHHAFEKAGWPESRVVWLFGLTQLVLVALALSVAATHPLVAR